MLFVGIEESAAGGSIFETSCYVTVVSISLDWITYY